jgi:GntR family transcriptional regulator
MTITDFLAAKDWLARDAGPRYLRLHNRMTDAVTRGLLREGTPLPPEREIAAITGLSRVTVRKAIALMAEKGLILQRQGSGSFISYKAPRIEQSLSRLTSFSEDMARRGKTSASRWLGRGMFMASADEVAVLGLGAHDQVARIARLRMADGQPLAIERASLPVDILPNPLAVETSLYEVLEARGLRPVRAVQKISALNLGAEEAALLEVAPGVAGLRIERISYLQNGRVAEFTRSLYRGDAYNFVAELRLTGD